MTLPEFGQRVTDAVEHYLREGMSEAFAEMVFEDIENDDEFELLWQAADAELLELVNSL